jgi:ubiquinone/menaquinone biosynthesis C-methylase UbiE
MRAVRAIPVAGASAVLAAALWWRTHPSACPYGQRFWVEAPHPFITRTRLREALEPSDGERLLEVGPGTGYYSLPVARWLGQGTLEILDLQREMLDHTLRAAAGQGLDNILATHGDAGALPYPDDRFDGAFLVAALGEVPDQEAALRELARVVRPGGRVVVGELFGDPHWVRLTALRHRAERAGLLFERRIGGPLGYFARLSVPIQGERHV